MIPPEQMEELRAICPDAREMSEGGLTYVYLPGLRLPEGGNPAASGWIALVARTRRLSDEAVCLTANRGERKQLELVSHSRQDVVCVLLEQRQCDAAASANLG